MTGDEHDEERRCWTLTRVSWRLWRLVRTEDGVETDAFTIGLLTMWRIRREARRNFARARLLRGGR